MFEKVYTACDSSSQALEYTHVDFLANNRQDKYVTRDIVFSDPSHPICHAISETNALVLVSHHGFHQTLPHTHGVTRDIFGGHSFSVLDISETGKTTIFQKYGNEVKSEFPRKRFFEVWKR